MNKRAFSRPLSDHGDRSNHGNSVATRCALYGLFVFGLVYHRCSGFSLLRHTCFCGGVQHSVFYFFILCTAQRTPWKPRTRVRTWVFPIRFRWSQDRDSANRVMVVVRSTTRPRLVTRDSLLVLSLGFVRFTPDHQRYQFIRVGKA